MTPVVIHIPHSSVFIPKEIRDELKLTDDELQKNLVAFTDWRTDDLFASPKCFCRIVFPVSRLVCDPERFRCDEDEPMSKVGNGAVYVKDAFLRPLRELSNDRREQILTHYYDSHHQKLLNAVSKAVQRHGKCIIVDAHSFSSIPLPYEPDQSHDRPDICIGTCKGHTSKDLEEISVAFFQSHGLSVSVNSPYSGAIVPLSFWSDSRVQSIMIEVSRGLYCKPNALEETSDYDSVKRVIGLFLDEISSL